MPPKRLIFFCELETTDLQNLFTEPTLLDHLLDLKAGLSLAVLDISPTRANIVRQLNQAEIPVVAWLLLPPEEGYWFNAHNVTQARVCYAEFQTWSQSHGLAWAGVGLNFQPHWQDRQQWRDNPLSFIPTALQRLCDSNQVYQAQAEYGALVAQIHNDGYQVESYIPPFLLDERQAKSTTLRNVTGLVDVPVDREVVMLYTSRLPKRDPALLWRYSIEASAVAVGVTGGGVQINPKTDDCLSWEDLARDLRLAQRWSHHIYIFSLEGCHAHGFLPHLKQIPWDEPLAPPHETLPKVQRQRQLLHLLLWISSRPRLVVGAILGLFGFGTIIWRVWRWLWRLTINKKPTTNN